MVFLLLLVETPCSVCRHTFFGCGTNLHVAVKPISPDYLQG